MNKLRIKSFGWQHQYLDQISRINIGFLENDAELVEDGEVDFIYSHDFSIIEKAHQYKLKYPKSKYLQKVLDIPIHCFDFDKEKLKKKLKYADLILSNSQHVQKEIKDILSFNSIVVYDCIKDLEYDSNIKKEIDFLAVGRLNDPEKRGFLIRDLCKIVKEKRTLVTCGPEKLGIGNELGIIDDSFLNSLYNASKFCLCLSRREGLYLPPLEALVCGCIPIACNDMTTVNETIPANFICEPNIKSIYNAIQELEKNYKLHQNVALEYGGKYKYFFDKKTVAKRIIDAYFSIV